MRPSTFHVSSFPASPLKEWCADCFGNWREHSSMVPKLRQHENFLTSNLCIPGLVRIPNHTVMEALTPHFVFCPTVAWLKCAAISGGQRKSTRSPASSPSLCSWGPPCWHQYACTQCARTGLLAAWHLQLYHKLTFKKYMTCRHDFGLHFYTTHTHLDKLGARQKLQWVNRKRRKGSNYKFSYIFSWRQSWSSSSLATHSNKHPLSLYRLYKYTSFQIEGCLTRH